MILKKWNISLGTISKLSLIATTYAIRFPESACVVVNAHYLSTQVNLLEVPSTPFKDGMFFFFLA